MCVGGLWIAERWEQASSGGMWRVGMHEVLPRGLTDSTPLLSHFLIHCFLHISLLPVPQRTSFPLRPPFMQFFLPGCSMSTFLRVDSFLPFWSQLEPHLLQELSSYATHLPAILSQLFASFFHGIDLTFALPSYLHDCNVQFLFYLFVYIFLVYLSNQNVESMKAKTIFLSHTTRKQLSHSAW